jgi:hypothetical protein
MTGGVHFLDFNRRVESRHESVDRVVVVFVVIIFVRAVAAP